MMCQKCGRCFMSAPQLDHHAANAERLCKGKVTYSRAGGVPTPPALKTGDKVRIIDAIPEFAGLTGTVEQFPGVTASTSDAWPDIAFAPDAAARLKAVWPGTDVNDDGTCLVPFRVHELEVIV